MPASGNLVAPITARLYTGSVGCGMIGSGRLALARWLAGDADLERSSHDPGPAGTAISSSPESPGPAVGGRSPEWAHPPSDLSPQPSSGTESLRADCPRPPGSSRSGPTRAQSRHGGASHIRVLPERIRNVTLPLPPSCRAHEKSSAEYPGGEYESTPTPARCRSVRCHRPVPAPSPDPTPTCPCLPHAAM